MARAARLSDGFNPVARATAAENEHMLKGELDAWHEAERDPVKPMIVMRVNQAKLTDQPIDGERHFLSGSVDQIRDDVKQLESWGVTELFFVASGLGHGQPGDLKPLLDKLPTLRSVV